MQDVTILGHALEGIDAHYIVPTDNDLKTAMNTYTQCVVQSNRGSFTKQYPRIRNL